MFNGFRMTKYWISEIQRLTEIYKKYGTNEFVKRVKRYFKKEFPKKLNYPLKLKFNFMYGPGILVVNEDWDNLIIFDACRFDIFEKQSTFRDHKLEKKISRGSWSNEWIKSNFIGKNMHDTVYVTSNGWSRRIPEGTFHRIIPLYDQPDARNPENVTQAALEANDKHPNKRLIIHYMQPHAPHLTELGQQWGWGIWSAALEGEITHSELVNSYTQNLRMVEDQFKILLSELVGKTVITSDHGENLGERGFSDGTGASRFGFNKQLYGHGFQTQECRFVPWCIIDDSTRKNVTYSEPETQREIDEEKRIENLRDLGYV